MYGFFLALLIYLNGDNPVKVELLGGAEYRDTCMEIVLPVVAKFPEDSDLEVRGYCAYVPLEDTEPPTDI